MKFGKIALGALGGVAGVVLMSVTHARREHAGVAYAQARNPNVQPFVLLGKCMDLSNGNVQNGTKIQLWDCGGGQYVPNQNQQWQWYGSTLRPSLNTNKCLDLTGFSTTNGTQIEIWDCNGGANQQWTVDPVFHYLMGYGGKCIDAPAFHNNNGTILDYWDCNKGTNQQFYFGGAQYCTQQSVFQCQDWMNTSSPPSWYRTFQHQNTFCGNSCTYGCPPGTYGSCPF